MGMPDQRRTRRETPLGALGPLAGIVAGFAVAAYLGWRSSTPNAEPHGPVGEPIARRPDTGPPDVAPTPPAVGTPRAASYRADMGLTGVFEGPCPPAPVAVRWRATTGGTPTGGIVWDGARFLVALAEGSVVALDATGRELWRRGAALDGIAAPPLADGERCLVASPKGTFAAFRATDGELLWRATAPMQFAVRNAPVLVDGNLIAISQEDGRLLALDPASGAVRWQGDDSVRCDGPLSAADGRVLFGDCNAAVQSHAPSNGMALASLVLGSDAQVAGAVAVREDRAVCGTRSGEVVMLDAAKHAVLWRTTVGESEVFSAPVLTEKLVVVTTSDAEVVALAAADGRERWRFATVAPSATSAILVGDAIVLAAAGTVLAIDAEAGSPRWRIAVADATTEPCAGAGLVVVGTDEGDVVAIGGTP